MKGTMRVSKASYGGSGKVLFQTPRFVARLEQFHRFPGAIIAHPRKHTMPEHIAEPFSEFIQDIETSGVTCVPEVRGKDMLDPFRKLTAFANASVFDDHGNHVENTDGYCGLYTMSALVQLDGAWISERVWGLNLKILQMQIHGDAAADPPPLPPRQRQFVDSPSNSPPRPRQFMFSDDV